ncbi:hypothetical protein EYC84_004655 [Monilinia fructicola]|uniref:Heme haloperoxidase family profile domain-containing protein n=1 Tax=Monilinia fructicola TaxID=38448 RepID=A0A5M9K137_MONFR|nr:hypothetical protein EYC84_004655 [Monilinia fructicola]
MASGIILLAFVAFSMLPIQILAFPTIALEAAIKNPDIASLAKAEYQKRHAKRSSPGFNATAQIIDVSGAHAFVPPGPNDLRGPCPGLNALANHNFIPHNGFATVAQLVSANEQVFGMGADLAVFLSIYGVVMDGNPISINPGWSIGGPPTQGQNLLGNLFGLLGAPQGLIGSHNKYEGDTSPTRGDLFVYGNSWKLQISQFQELFDLQPDAATANYDIGSWLSFATSHSRGAYARILISSMARQYPEGILDQFNLKSFFGVTGESRQFVKKDGWERIPFGWGKRAIGDEYGILEFADDILYFTSQYPTPSHGVYDIPTLLSGNNIACFLLQNAQLTAPDILRGLFADITEPLGILTEVTGGLLSSLGSCPQLKEVDETKMSIFPGSGATL